GEFDEAEAGEAMSDRKLIGDMVAHWKKLASDRKTVGFATTKKNAELYAAEFRAAGIRSVSVNDSTPDRDRRSKDGTITLGRETVWERLRIGEIKVVWSVGIVSYGWDMPEVNCLILARPTMSLALCLQQIGRGLRSHPGKTDCIILDHAGNVLRRYAGGQYGLPDAPREWTLEPRRKSVGLDESVEVESLPLVCPRCPEPRRVLKLGTPACPECGYVFAKTRHSGTGEIEHDKAAELVKVESRVYIYPDKTGNSQHDQMIDIARRHNYNPGWIDYRLKALDVAREKYRRSFAREPKEYWTSAMINSMLKFRKEVSAQGELL
ncbi:MAG: DEAD/DEAH box helicase, partial [Candidatus Saccharimonadales bacterium]